MRQLKTITDGQAGDQAEIDHVMLGVPAGTPQVTRTNNVSQARWCCALSLPSASKSTLQHPQTDDVIDIELLPFRARPL